MDTNSRLSTISFFGCDNVVLQEQKEKSEGDEQMKRMKTGMHLMYSMQMRLQADTSQLRAAFGIEGDHFTMQLATCVL